MELEEIRKTRIILDKAKEEEESYDGEDDDDGDDEEEGVLKTPIQKRSRTKKEKPKAKKETGKERVGKARPAVRHQKIIFIYKCFRRVFANQIQRRSLLVVNNPMQKIMQPLLNLTQQFFLRLLIQVPGKERVSDRLLRLGLLSLILFQ
jgi:hypothetical protein